MKITPLLLTGLLLAAGAALFANPQYVNYQGILNDGDGDPLPTGDYTMEFQIHRDLLADSLIWGPFLFDGTNGPGHSAMVHVTNGRFNVILGPADTGGRAIGVAFAEDPATPDQCFVEIRVNGGEPILPRQQILTVPYAFEAQNARNLNLVAPVHYLNPPGMMTPFAGPRLKEDGLTNVPEGWLVCDGTEYLAADYPDLYDAIGMAWGGREEVISPEEAHIYFRVPDMRGMFLRGVSGSRDDGYQDPDAGTRVASASNGLEGNRVGTYQLDKTQEHSHRWGEYENQDLFSWNSESIRVMALNRLASNQIPGGSGKTDDYMDVQNVPGGFWTKREPPILFEDSMTETRPNNATVHFIIKF